MFSAGTNVDFGNYYSLIIGNNSYQILPKLQTAINDAKALAETLQNYYGYRVQLILDGSRRSIVSAMNHLRPVLTHQNNLLIYYTGHGYFDEDADRGYWASG